LAARIIADLKTGAFRDRKTCHAGFKKTFGFGKLIGLEIEAHLF
jgi:hypothetical protein